MTVELESAPSENRLVVQHGGFSCRGRLPIFRRLAEKPGVAPS